MTKRLRHEKRKKPKNLDRATNYPSVADSFESNSSSIELDKSQNMPSNEDCQKYIEAVKHAFTENWLDNKSINRNLQQLWMRRHEHFANIELLTLGHALIEMRAIDEEWVAGVVKDTMKGKGDYGKLYELLCLALFDPTKLMIEPATRSQPAYDATIHFPLHSHKMYLSIKRHDMTAGELEFRSESRSLRKVAQKAFERLGKSGELLVVGSDTRLERTDWESLKEHLQRISALPYTTELRPGLKFLAREFVRRWDEDIAKNVLSDLIITIGKESKNDQKNFCQKMEEAALKFKKAGIEKSEDCSRVAFLRLHHSANNMLLAEYAQLRLNDVDDPIELDSVILYQPSIVRKGEETYLQHHILFVDSKEFAISKMPIALAFRIGKVSLKASKNVFRIGEAEIDLKGHYLFQESDIYLPVQETLDILPQTYILRNPAPGIRSHLATPTDPVKGKGFATEEELLIL